DLLFFRRATAREETGDTETVRKIIRELESIPPEKARYVAAFAFILARVAHADLDISLEETRRMEQILLGLGHLPVEQAVLAVQIAKAQHRLAGGTESFLVTREFKEVATREQCRELLDCLFAVSAADDSISAPEEAQIRQIASELGFSLGELVEIRSAWSHKRDVLKGFGGKK
ncbi:MAG TPA: TerB family tellurite resistance protein, partial [Thermoanaerobaculia bacterium]|nr:TerB family tellurite resistance protein [Thermoanaerobaculia bacterium]